MPFRVLPRSLSGMLCLLGAALSCGEGSHPPSADPFPASLKAIAAGTLRISILGDAPSQEAVPVRHRTRFVNDTAYRGMEDNDLRGYLDGRFKYAWNQPGQVHVRLGRRGAGERYAEHELFRVLQVWSDVVLPPGARLLETSLRLHVEHGPDRCIEILLYEVKRAWTPGIGGTRSDNVSPPNPGEVWWNDAKFGEVPWALPGLGRASDAAPDADTGTMALASSPVCPGDVHIALNSPRLAEYAESQILRRAPLRFLLKLDDLSEDRAASVITLYSGNGGAARETSRRPHLNLEWEIAALATEDFPVRLERGRSALVAPAELAPAARARARYVTASYVPEPDSAPLHIEHPLPAGDDWAPLAHTHALNGASPAVRITAGADPIALGQPFRDQLRDTWIRTAAPSDQQVPWTFVSPSGVEHRVLATYEEPYRWRVTFLPDEVGPWSYHWSQRFTETELKSPMGYFDVVPRELGPVLQSLAQLAERARQRGTLPDGTLQRQLAMLERAGMSVMTGTLWRSDEGALLRAATGEVRAALGDPAPDPIPMVPDDPPEWASPSDD